MASPCSEKAIANSKPLQVETNGRAAVSLAAADGLAESADAQGVDGTAGSDPAGGADEALFVATRVC